MNDPGGGGVVHSNNYSSHLYSSLLVSSYSIWAVRSLDGHHHHPIIMNHHPFSAQSVRSTFYCALGSAVPLVACRLLPDIILLMALPAAQEYDKENI